MIAAPRTSPSISASDWNRFERIGAWVVLIGVFTTLFGLSWDVQWHSDVGPDTFWTVPHLFVYSGAALTGFAALTVVLLCTMLARNTSRPSGWMSVFGYFYAPVGFVVAGFGAFGFLSFGVFDQWWHTIFGFDVTISSPPHLGLIFSDILSMVGCALIFARGRMIRGWSWGAIGLAASTAFAVAFSLPFLVAVFSDFDWIIPLITLQAVLIPLGMLFVVSVTRNPWMALVTALGLIAFRWMSELFFPAMTLGYAESLGLALRDGSRNNPELPQLIPIFTPLAGLLAAGILAFWKARGGRAILGVLLAGFVATVALYLDSRMIPLKGVINFLIVGGMAIVGAACAWTGWQLGVIARHISPEPEVQPLEEQHSERKLEGARA
jgi:hypothetical protein